MTWNAHQQAMLEAMGYTLWRATGAAPASLAGEAAVSRPGDAGSRVEEGAAAPRLPVRPPGLRDGEDPLLRALRRAAGGRDPSPLLPPLAQLRGDAAAKRALWPRLRALRRS